MSYRALSGPTRLDYQLDAETRAGADLLRRLNISVDLGDVQIVYVELPGVDSKEVSIDLEG